MCVCVHTLKYFIKTRKDKRIPEIEDQGCLTKFKHLIDNGLFICSEEAELSCPSACSKFDTNDSSTLDQLLTLPINWKDPSREEASLWKDRRCHICYIYFFVKISKKKQPLEGLAPSYANTHCVVKGLPRCKLFSFQIFEVTFLELTIRFNSREHILSHQWLHIR